MTIPTADMTDAALKKHLKVTAKRAWDASPDDDLKPYKQLMWKLSRSKDYRVRAWVARQDELSVKVVTALLDDPDERVRHAAGLNTEVDYAVDAMLKKRFDARLKEAGPGGWVEVLRETANSYIAIERIIVAKHYSTPADVREHLALYDPVGKVRAYAIKHGDFDAATMNKVIAGETDDYVLNTALRNSTLDISPETFRAAFARFHPGRLSASIANNDHAPADVLDAIARSNPDDYSLRYDFTSALDNVAQNPNTARDTIQALLDHTSSTVAKNTREAIDYRRERLNENW